MENTNKKGLLRVVALVLLVVTVGALFLTACGGDDKKPSTTTASGSSINPGDDTNSTNALVREKYAAYADAYKGQEFKILSPESGSFWYGSFMSDTFNEIWYETDSSEPLESSIYTRNRYVEDLLGITISPVFVTNEENDRPADRLRTAVETGSKDYDMVLQTLNSGLVTSMEGHCANLRDIETLDLSNPWWDQNMGEAYTIFNSNQYMTAGHINVFDDMSILLLMFNKDMCEELSIDPLYHYVRENNWTIDTVAELCEKTRRKVTQGSWGLEDIYGTNQCGGYFHGFNLPQTETDEDGVPQLTIEREEHVNAALKLYETIVENEYYLDEALGGDATEMFSDGQIFLFSNLTCMLNRFRNLTIEFGVMPYPKLNAEQTKYSHYVNQEFFTVFVIPSFVQDQDRAGLVMDVMGGFSTDTIYKTTFGTLMGYDSKLLRDNDSKDMLDIVMQNRQFDYSIYGFGELNSKIYR
ncbi:MAG: hypothetical protein ACI4V1_05850, partial [Eubacteriales bacterium]